ncbi:hypothetical protein FRX31_019342 [Thalictrum thalictroides]|uniref:Transmembrane protein n=1 Tax=Thalictrum thalictroides TaxID=46969 RepID=A0A7J6W1T7_THATH|nr:hypothetical protein FRX31_019342 [Thalictrum thalictroides]
MDSLKGLELMELVAVSGGVVFLVLHFIKRLQKIESDVIIGLNKHQQRKKKVRFADTVVEPSSNNKEYRKHCRVDYRKQLDDKCSS